MASKTALGCVGIDPVIPRQVDRCIFNDSTVQMVEATLVSFNDRLAQHF